MARRTDIEARINARMKAAADEFRAARAQVDSVVTEKIKAIKPKAAPRRMKSPPIDRRKVT